MTSCAPHSPARWARFRDLPFPTRHQRHHHALDLPRLPGGRDRGHRRPSCSPTWTCTSASSSTPRCSAVERGGRVCCTTCWATSDIQRRPRARSTTTCSSPMRSPMLPPPVRESRAAADAALAVKFSNTLVVQNHRTLLHRRGDVPVGPAAARPHDEPGEGLRDALGRRSADLVLRRASTPTTSCNAVAMNLVPVTTCTDLLRPGGYARLARATSRTSRREMRRVGRARSPRRLHRALRGPGRGGGTASRGGAGSASRGACSRTAPLRDRGRTARPRTPRRSAGGVARGGVRGGPRLAVPAVRRRLRARVAPQRDPGGVRPAPTRTSRAWSAPHGGWRALLTRRPRRDAYHRRSTLSAGSNDKACRARSARSSWLYDCINCDKCVPVCPNDANFVYEMDAADVGSSRTPTIAAEGRRARRYLARHFIVGEGTRSPTTPTSATTAAIATSSAPRTAGRRSRSPGSSAAWSRTAVTPAGTGSTSRRRGVAARFTAPSTGGATDSSWTRRPAARSSTTAWR